MKEIGEKNSMKKRICFLMAALLLPLSGCNGSNDVQDDKLEKKDENINIVPTGTFKVDFIGNCSTITDLPKEENRTFAPGSEIVLHSSVLMDTDLAMFVNGEYVSTGSDVDNAWEYRFVMPEHDSVVEFKVGDYLAPSMYASLSILDFDDVLYCPYRVVDGKGVFYVNTFRRFALNIKNTKGTTYKGDVIELLDSNGETINKSKLRSMAIDDFPSENEKTIYTLLFYVEGNYELNIKVDDLTYSIKFVCSDSKEDWPTFVSDIKTILGWPIEDKVTTNNVTKVSLETNVSGHNGTANYSTDSEDIAKTVAIFDTAVFKIDYYSVGSGGSNKTFSYYYNDKVNSFEVKDTFMYIGNAKYLVDSNFYDFKFTNPVRMV